MKKLFLPLLITALSATTLHAAIETPDTIELSPVVVTASRTPEHLNQVAQSVTLIERADIEALPADSVADLLEYVSGVDVRQRAVHGVQSDVSIRGGSYEQTLVLLNGISLSNPQTGHHNMDIPVSLNDIERIEIIKGPGARIYGANAMAGVINIITRRTDAPSIRAELKTGEHDYQASALHTNFAAGAWNNTLSAAQQYSSGFDDDEPTGFNLKTLNYQGRGRLGAHELELGAAYTDKKFGASRFYFDAPNQKEQTRTFLSYVAADLQLNTIHWRPQLSWLKHDDIYDYQFGPNWYQNNTETNKYTAQLTGDTQTRWGNSTFGFSSEREEIDSSNLGDHGRESYNLFVNHKLPLTDHLTIGAGASAVYYSDWGWEYWPGAEASYAITPKLQWFASVAKSFRIPTYLEMYYNTPTNIGNPDLEPEEAWSWESGLRWQQKRLSANLSVFLRESDNLIDWSRANASEPWRVRNVAESTTSGVEVGFDLKQPLAALPVLGRVALSYTYLDHDADSGGLESKYSLNNLRHQLHGSVWFNWHPRLTHVIKARLEERMFGDSSVVFDSKLSYQLRDNIELSVEGTNLLDEDYIESGDAPMPGRWLMAGIQWQHDLF